MHRHVRHCLVALALLMGSLGLSPLSLIAPTASISAGSADGPGSGGSQPGGDATGCVVGRELLTNGDFALPGLAQLPSFTADYKPDGWGGYASAYGPSYASIFDYPYSEGEIRLTNLKLNQAIDLSGLGGATVTLSTVGQLRLVMLGDRSLTSQIVNTSITFTVTEAEATTGNRVLFDFHGDALASVSLRIATCPPAVLPDRSYETFADRPLTVPAATGLLARGFTSVQAATFETARGGTVNIDATGAFTYVPPVNPDGSDSFDVTAYRADLTTDTATVTITLTPVPVPLVVTPSTISLSFVENGSAQTVTISATSPDQPATMQVRFASDDPTAALATRSVSNIRRTGPATLATDLTFTPRSDVSGTATSTIEVVFLVDDREVVTEVPLTITIAPANEPPVFDPTSVPDRIEVTTADGSAIPVTRDPILATDPDSEVADQRTDVTCTAPLGPDDSPVSVVFGQTLFPVGDTIVTCTAEDIIPDGAIGADEPVTVTFTVRVTDVTPPTVSVPGALTVDGGGSDRAVVRFATPSATDNTGASLPVGCSLADGTTVTSGITLPVGRYVVTCEATDKDGRTGEATFTITVRDGSGPGITWIGGPVRGGVYPVGRVPAAPICTGVATGAPVIQCRVTGYSDQPGRHIMTARARDAAGNVTVETRTYTVTGASQPTAAPVTPRPTTPVVTPIPTQPPPTVPTRPARTPVATPTPAPTQPPAAPTRPPRR